jgi:hypothetical protein
MFRKFSVAVCAVSAIGIMASSPTFAAGKLSQYSVQKSGWSQFARVGRPSLQDKVTLNPQPLPPRADTFRAAR